MVLFLRLRGFVVIEILDFVILTTTVFLLIIALSLPDQFIYYSGDASSNVQHFGTGGVAVNVTSVSARVGAFKWRIGFNVPASPTLPGGFSYDSELQQIASDCSSTFDAPVGYQTIGDISCKQFQVFRAIYIVGLVAVSAVAIFKFAEVFRGLNMSRLPVMLWVLHGIGRLLSFCVPVSNFMMSSLISQAHNGTSTLAPSYQILIAALILSACHGLLNIPRCLHSRAEAKAAKQAAKDAAEANAV